MNFRGSRLAGSGYGACWPLAADRWPSLANPQALKPRPSRCPLPPRSAATSSKPSSYSGDVRAREQITVLPKATGRVRAGPGRRRLAGPRR